jgi:lipopolysaccharide transport system permease protein
VKVNLTDSTTSQVPDLTTKPLHIRRPSGKANAAAGLRETWAYRELLYFLTWREVKVRYKQTVLGAAWAIIQPFFTMVVFSLFFGRLAKIPSDGIPYPIWSYAALLPWQFFSQSLAQASGSVVGNSNLIRKVYFPRMVIPISGVLFGLVDFAIAFTVLLAMMFYFGTTPTWGVVLLPLFLILAIIVSLGAGLWLSALTAEYRDFRFVLPFLTQIWMFATPVVYPSSLLPEPWRTLYGLNPMVGVVEGFRWALLGTNPPGPMIYVSAAAALVLFISGAGYFRRMERTFADVI